MAILALLITVVWAIIAIADLFLENYTGLSIATPVMLLVAGAILGLRKSNGAKH